MIKSTKYINGILTKINNYYNELEEKNIQNNEKLQKAKKNLKSTISDKQLYLQNLEKRINEISSYSMETKEKRGLTLSKNQTKNDGIKPQENGQPVLDKKLKKYKLCQQFIATGFCRNGDECNLAHRLKDLDTEYIPRVWVSHFENHKPNKNPRPVTQETRKEFFERLSRSTSTFARVTQQDESFENILFKSSSSVDVDKIINKKGRTLLMEAVIQEKNDNVKKLLLLGGSISLQDWTGCDSIVHAIKKNNWIILNILLDYCKVEFDLDKCFFSSKMTYLMLAAKNMQSRIIKILLLHKANPNIIDNRNRSALFYSVERNDFESVKALIEEGAAINFVDLGEKTCLDVAFETMKINIVSYLFTQGAVMADNTKHRKLLFMACEHSRKELINELIKRGISSSETNSEGNNILLISYLNGHYELCIDLIEEFSLFQLINQPNKEGDNVFLKSVKDGNMRLARFFMSKPNVEIDFKDRNGKTALIYASENGDYRLVDDLLKANADINMSDKTALIMASKNSHFLAAETLLRTKQANLLWKDSVEMSARNYAQHNEEMRKLITTYMINSEKLSESLSKELKDEMFDYKKYYTTKVKKETTKKTHEALNPLEKAHLFRNKLF